MPLRFTIVFLLTFCGFAQSAFAQGKIIEYERSNLVIGTTYQLRGVAYEAKREINVWVPPSYAEGDENYPVLYVIDGGLDQDFHHISGLAQLATINGSIKEMIVVGIKTQNRIKELAHKQNDPRYVKLVPDLGESDRFLKHIAEEVIPFVEENFRTGERRAVIGESLAGLFIAEIFLKHPSTFTDYISISPSLWWDDKALAKSAMDLIAAHDAQTRKLYLTMADEGGTMQRGLELIIEAINQNKPAGLEMHYVDRSKAEIHSTIYHPAAHDALLKLFGLRRPSFGIRPWYLTEGGEPPEAKKDK